MARPFLVVAVDNYICETCKLVGNFLLSQLQHLDINMGLYRDDGLAITNATPRQTENIKKEICQIFNRNGLRITIEANKQVVNFLDVTLNLHKSTYQPFTKPKQRFCTSTARATTHSQSQETYPFGINKQSILRPSRPSIPRNTRRKRIQLYPAL